MSMSFALTALPSITPLDLNVKGMDENARIKQVAKAMESLFAGQLMAEMGKGLDGSEDKQGGMYSDFIQKALTQSFTSSHNGLGLETVLENALTHHPIAPHPGPKLGKGK